MPQSRRWIRKEIRIMGAIQIMTGLMIHSLGVLWSYMLLTQFIAFHKEYFPLVAITGYSFWSSWSFTFSGIFTTVVEKSSSISLMSYTIYLNISSACIAMTGLLLLSLEFAIFSLNAKTIMWPHRAGKLLSQYLTIFTILELSVAITVTHWVKKAKKAKRAAQ